jgi:hypothetical protein
MVANGEPVNFGCEAKQVFTAKTPRFKDAKHVHRRSFAQADGSNASARSADTPI